VQTGAPTACDPLATILRVSGPPDPERDATAQHEPRPRRSALENPFVWAALAGLVLIPLLRPLLRFEPPPPPVISTLSDFRLVDQDGAAFGPAQLGEAVHVVGFVFTRCTTVCPFVVASLQGLARRYDEAGEERVRLLLISVDPEHDRPEVLRELARSRGLAGARWRLVTGDPEAVRGLVVEEFLVAMGEPTTTGGMVEIAHTGRLAIVDRDGGVRGFYDTTAEGLDEVFHRSRTVAGLRPRRR
jgi:protein SCO1/2